MNKLSKAHDDKRMDAIRIHTPKPAMVRHTYTVTIDVPARSGDGWNRYPDYSADEIGRLLRRAIHAHTEHAHTVTPVSTEPIR